MWEKDVVDEINRTWFYANAADVLFLVAFLLHNIKACH